MSDAPPPAGLSSGVASRFVSSTALDEAKKKREEEWKAAYARIGQEPPKEMMPGGNGDEKYDPRSLYEKLQEQKNKKQEAFEEQLKFKNHFRSLDEDEVSFLDSMVDESNEEERERQRQIRDELQGFRAAVTKRGAPPPPPGVSPPLAASTSTASTSPSTSASGTPAPKIAAAPKKGKKKTLPGLVVKKKPTPSAASTSPPAPSPSSSRPATTSTTAAVSGAVPSETKKRPADDAEQDGPGTKAEGDKGDEEEGAKKRKVES
ncbi:hypothetical protein JCM11251_002031 [Rhodosporidiobolus azoricus]